MKRTLSPTENTAQAFVPGHVTGIFRIYDTHSDPLQRGSMGAGFSISIGTLTTVTINENSKVEITTTYNGKLIDATVTRTVVERMLNEHKATLSVEVNHESDLPIGVGFGASGAGALGTALSLSSILDEDFNYTHAAQHAHYAEVIQRAGLGDVIAQTSGGLEIRIQPGAPGIGKVRKLECPSELAVVLAGSTGLETKNVLSDPLSRDRINQTGDSLLDDLLLLPNLSTTSQSHAYRKIVDASKEFSKRIGLMTPRIRDALTTLESEGFDMSSMVMLGDSVFCMCETDQTNEVESILENFWASNEILITNISDIGGRLL